MSDQKVKIDVLTLDSVQCAACGYMMESIAAMPPDVQEMIEYKEWSIKTKSGIGKFLELNGKVLPTICIEGDLVFESIIPQYEELIDELAKRAPTPEMSERIKSLRDVGFDFDNIKANLQKAGSGLNTRAD
ncbi:hypothetical protein [Desulfotomaculum copahuensis]|uniref:Uncharacterized protein n=1 Tax=Desulfotomaculum copahuensis TaxID=1838280 RepID=A0A1B7LI97_9FIRM|nr:hypothetical protein [Desulfotomaculum copahuensis]OAT86132.1 hypothetical protein A6M21_04260 [Desulfotomaculum copahuensis]